MRLDKNGPMTWHHGLNEVRPRRPEQFVDVLEQVPMNRSLNEVRPRRPEQSTDNPYDPMDEFVSMKSGLEGRNNRHLQFCCRRPRHRRLNEVRPRRPEQSGRGRR